MVIACLCHCHFLPSSAQNCANTCNPALLAALKAENERLRAEKERLQDLLMEEISHDHDCYGHNGNDRPYDDAWLLFYTPYQDCRGGDHTPLGAEVNKRYEARRALEGKEGK